MFIIIKMTETVSTTTSGVDYSTYYTGRVKWFNNKSGYGFITVVSNGSELPDGVTTLVGEDIFSHHSAILVGKEQFRYLVQGEYVSFKLSLVENETHKYQSTDISGLSGGKLLCETREEQRSTRTVPDRPSVRKGRGPRDGDDGEWKQSTSKRNYKSSRSVSNEKQG